MANDLTFLFLREFLYTSLSLGGYVSSVQGFSRQKGRTGHPFPLGLLPSRSILAASAAWRVRLLWRHSARLTLETLAFFTKGLALLKVASKQRDVWLPEGHRPTLKFWLKET